MTRDQFLRRRQPQWRRFDELLKIAERGHKGKSLSGNDLSEFSALYRSLCFDLSLVQSRDWGESMSKYLNNLAARGHNIVYRSRPGSLRAIYDFLAFEFPRLLRANAVYFWIAFVLFYLPGLIAGIIVANDPSMAGSIMPGMSQAMMEEMYSESIGESGLRDIDDNAMMAGFYVRNNVGIAFKCFALGAFAGIGTIIVLIYNSIFLGAVSGLLVGRGLGNNFLEFVIGHGSFELTAIVVAGMAGLMLGHAMVHPGELSRSDSLRTRGLDAVRIALGAGAMLVVAAFIEGFWSPLSLPFEVKIVAGVILWIIVFAYLVYAGRTKSKAMNEVDRDSSFSPVGRTEGLA